MTLSVALCTYNGERFIFEQLESILRQELPVNEIIICDDQSSDGTIQIVNEIAKSNPQIKWIINRNSERLGVTKNFEKALSSCNGDIIFLSDQDDIWFPEKTATIAFFLEKHPKINLVYSNAELIDEEGNLLTERTLFDACGLTEVMEAWDMGLQFEIENVIQRLLGATFGIRRDFLLECLPFHTEVRNYHDGQLAMQSVVDNCNGRIDKCLIRYRIHSQNVVGLGGNEGGRLTKNDNRNYWEDLIEPREINSFFLLPCAKPIRPRVLFFLKRERYYSQVWGKFILMGSFLQYIKYYRRYWFFFYLSDLLYGVFNNLRRKIVLKVK